MIFPMSLDKVHRWSTIAVMGIVGGVIVAVSVGVGGSANGRSPLPAWMPPLFGVFIAGVLGLAWAMAPRALELRGRQLRILRRAWPAFVIALEDITAVEPGPTLRRGVSMRLAGTGGFFGSYGLFWTRGFGRYRLWATRIEPTLCVRRHDGLPVVVTPDDVERVRQALEIWRRPDHVETAGI